MTDHIEWVEAKVRPLAYTSLELMEISADDGDYKHVGLRLGQSDGAMLYGTMTEMIDWLEAAVLEVKRVQGVEKALHNQWVTEAINLALSRDDVQGHGKSEFEERVEVIRQLNSDSMGDPPYNDEPNYDYRRGQIEFLMQTTAWYNRQHVAVSAEDVYFYVFNEEMP